MERIEYGITRSYAKTRRWGEWESIREIIQNALDETERAKGRPGYVQKIDDAGLHIIDEGDGIAIHNLLIGESHKSCWARGQFGEGLKVAFVVLLDKGHDIEIFSHEYHIKPQFIKKVVGGKEVELLVVDVNKLDTPAKGTQVSILGVYTDYSDNFVNMAEGNKKIVLELPVPITRCSEAGESHIAKIQVIKERNGIEPRIYVRDIYVGAITTLYGKGASYSYNLVNITLDESRKIPQSSDVYREIGKVLSILPSETLWGTLLAERADVFEANADFVSNLDGIDRMIRDAVGDDEARQKRHLRQLIGMVKSVVHQRFGANPVLIDHSHEKALARYFGYEPIAVQGWSLSQYVDTLMRKAGIKHINKLRLEMTTTDEIADNALTPPELQELKGLRALAKVISDARVVAMASHTAHGTATESLKLIGINRNLLNAPGRSQAINTLIHELAHIELGGDDNTAAMIDAVNKIGGQLIKEMLHNPLYQKRIRQAFGFKGRESPHELSARRTAEAPERTLEFYGYGVRFGIVLCPLCQHHTPRLIECDASCENCGYIFGSMPEFHCKRCGHYAAIKTCNPDPAFHCSECGSVMVRDPKSGRKC